MAGFFLDRPHIVSSTIHNFQASTRVPGVHSLWIRSGGRAYCSSIFKASGKLVKTMCSTTSPESHGEPLVTELPFTQHLKCQYVSGSFSLNLTQYPQSLVSWNISLMINSGKLNVILPGKIKFLSNILYFLENSRFGTELCQWSDKCISRFLPFKFPLLKEA